MRGRDWIMGLAIAALATPGLTPGAEPSPEVRRLMEQYQQQAAEQRPQPAAPKPKSVAPKPKPVAPRPKPVAPTPRPAPAPTRKPAPAPVAVAGRGPVAAPAMVRIPGGRFLMGSPASESERESDEGPQRWVQVPAFELGRYEVTFAHWDACVAAGGCSRKPDDKGWGRGKRPVINVSWEDAQEYVRWLSRRTGEPWRLPTEAEWEYAARAGTSTPFSTGTCITTRQSNYNGNYDYNDCWTKTGVFLNNTQTVGRYPPNPWGLYDMHGNVDEWVEDCARDNYTSAPTDGSAYEQESCIIRVLRGGSWLSYPRGLRSADRNWSGSGNRGGSVGFRVARALTP